MAAALSDRIRQKAYDFAKEYIASRPELHEQKEFPVDLWESMGRKGLLGLGIPEKFGGSGGDYLSIAVVGKALTEGGKNLGCSLTWLMHQLVARYFFLGQGSARQHNTYLPDMARGETTACIAISEPQGGGHPKYLTTTAEPDGSNYLITGEKTFLTNAPLADLFIVFAVVGKDDEKKRFSAFLVPRDSEGLTLGDPLDFGFLHPCPHAGIILEGCPVPADAVLGRPGSAYEDMALMFREVEDAMMMGPISGGIGAQLDRLVHLIQDQAVPLREDLDARLGEIASTASALGILTFEAARMLENEGHPELPSILIFCRKLAAQTQTQFKELIGGAGIQTDTLYDLMTNDLVRCLRIAANVAAIKQKKLGRALLS